MAAKSNDIATRFATERPTVCLVCRRQAIWLGYAPRQGLPIAWVCGDPKCTELAREVYKMSRDRLNHHEREAMRAAIDAAGPYLDQIGVTDLSRLTMPDMDAFLEKLLVAYEGALRDRILSDAPPF